MADAMKLVPVDDINRPFSDSLLPPEMIYAGMAALDQAETDMANYVPGVTTDWDQGMMAVSVYRAMVHAALTAREEAPAEGVGHFGAITGVAAAVEPSQGGYDVTSVLEEVLGATSEPARRAVAWRFREHPNSGWVYTGLGGRHDGCEVQPLFTHPATATADKLRVALEALEPFARAAGKLDGLWSEDDWRWNESVRSNVTVRDIRRAAQALAALTEEG